MSVAVHDTREDKLKWLLRPIQWASSLSFFSAVFGLVYWYYGFYDANWITVGLCAVLAVNAVLLLWGTARLSNLVRRAF